MAQYSNETKDVILQRMLDNSDPSVDKREGSVTNDLLSPAAIELAQAYIDLDNVLTFGFASEDMPSNYLDLRSAEVGLTRKPSTKAVGKVTFNGTDGTVIAIGSRVSTDEETPKYFVTTTEGTITGGSITVDAEAEKAGADGNVAAGQITLVAGDLSGVTSVNNSADFSGGADTETDNSLLTRYFEKVRKPATSGNANAYVQWAKAVSGVGDAKVYPLWNGNGTVKVIVIGDDKTAPTQTVVDSVTTYVEDRRPIGASVTVQGAVEIAIDITATLVLESGYALADAQTEIESALASYLADLAFVDDKVRYSHIGNLIIDTSSVKDYSSLTVNGGTANITVADGEVAVKGVVTLS